MDKKELQKVLDQHKLWINYEDGGQRADLRWAELRGAELRWADLRWAELQWANLREADLQEADLQGANLREADLRGANLQEAKLRWANLQEAKLRWADLRWADLREADLQEAKLREADLQEVDLQGANLREADLQEADLQGANLQEADLQGANLPPPTILLLCYWSVVSDKLCLELMRYDASNHPELEKFNDWANDGECPYTNCKWQRSANFRENKELWKPGKSKSALELVLMLFEEKGINYVNK